MNATHTLVSAVALAFLIGGSPAKADTITLVADEWCPYNCTPGSAKPGYMIEIAQKVFGEAGHTIDYKNLPWSRAIAESRLGKYDGIVGAAVGDAEDFKFPGLPMGKASNVFWVNKGDAWKYSTVASLDTISLGTIRDYSYSEEIDAYVAKNEKDAKRVQIASGDSALDTNFKKLAAKRVGAVIENGYVAQNFLAESGQAGKFQTAGETEADDVYIAFSPASPKGQQYAKLLGDGIAKLRSSGELAKILAKYGVSDWNK